MAAEIPMQQSSTQWTVAERRQFLRLPLDERRRRLETQAAQMVKHYASASECSERDHWQGDIVAS